MCSCRQPARGRLCNHKTKFTRRDGDSLLKLYLKHIEVYICFILVLAEPSNLSAAGRKPKGLKEILCESLKAHCSLPVLHFSEFACNLGLIVNLAKPLRIFPLLQTYYISLNSMPLRQLPLSHTLPTVDFEIFWKRQMFKVGMIFCIYPPSNLLVGLYQRTDSPQKSHTWWPSSCSYGGFLIRQDPADADSCF